MSDIVVPLFLGKRGGGESTSWQGPQPFVRITLYSQEELEHYHLDQSDLEHPGDFDMRPSAIVENKTPLEESSEMETGNLSPTDLLPRIWGYNHLW